MDKELLVVGSQRIDVFLHRETADVRVFVGREVLGIPREDWDRFAAVIAAAHKRITDAK